MDCYILSIAKIILSLLQDLIHILSVILDLIDIIKHIVTYVNLCNGHLFDQM